MASIVIILVAFIYYMIYHAAFFSLILDTHGEMCDYTDAVFHNCHLKDYKCTLFIYI